MTSADDTTPLDPPPTASHGAPDSPPSFSPPMAAGGFHTDPTAQVPVAPTAQLPMQPVQPSVVQPSVVQPSVVLDRNAAVKKSSAGKVAWALAAVLGIAAAAFAMLWVGKSGDADDLAAERDTLVADVATLQEQVATAEAELETTQADLDAASDDLDAATAEATDLQTQVDELDAQVTDLSAQIEELEQAPPAGGRQDLSPALALNFGRALGDGASPPLTDAEATCLGNEVYKEVGFEALLELGFSTDPSEADFETLFEGLVRATAACGLDFDRLN